MGIIGWGGILGRKKLSAVFRVSVISSHQQIGWLSTLSLLKQVAIDMLLLPSHAGLLLICYSLAMVVIYFY